MSVRGEGGEVALALVQKVMDCFRQAAEQYGSVGAAEGEKKHEEVR